MSMKSVQATLLFSATLLALAIPIESPGEEAVDDFPPLVDMYDESSDTWNWAVIHIRCAGVYMLAQGIAAADPSVTNRYIDKGQYHVDAAALHQSRRLQQDYNQAQGEVVARAHETGYRYGDLAADRFDAGEDVLKEPTIARDLSFCEGIEAPYSYAP